MHQNIRRAGAITTAALLAFGLASCSGGQSTADACAIVQDTMTESVNSSQSEVQSAMSDLMSGKSTDFSAIFAPVNKALEDAQGQVTNTEVSEKLDAFVAEYGNYTAVLEDVDLSAFEDIAELSNIDPTDPEAMEKAEELQAKAQELQETSTELQAAVQKEQDSLSAASKDLQDVCNS